MAFLGHLELMKLFERVFRFNKLPLKYSEGFNPIPKMTFASPLSVGYSSKGEIMEVQLEKEVPIDSIKALKFPDGIEVLDAKYTESKKSLMATVTHSEFLIKVDFSGPIAQLPFQEWLERFTTQTEILFEKKAKNGKMRTLNIIEYIHSIHYVYSQDNELIVRAMLQSSSQGSLNPETLIEVMCNYLQIPQSIQTIRVEKMGLYYEEDAHLNSLFLAE